jgi:hypothetical protein
MMMGIKGALADLQSLRVNIFIIALIVRIKIQQSAMRAIKWVQTWEDFFNWNVNC